MQVKILCWLWRGSAHRAPSLGFKAGIADTRHPKPHTGLMLRKSDAGHLFCLSFWRKVSSAPFTSQELETLKIICR